MGKIKRRLYAFWWKIAGYPDLPPKIFNLEAKRNTYTAQLYWPRYYDMAYRYLQDEPIESIANGYNVTRERVRQCIWKAYREN
jgi:hypothetical protein